MSTAGKVLTVLVLLVVPIWVLLVAAVADLNTNGTRAVQALKDQVAKLEADVIANQKAIESKQDQIAFEQTAMDTDRTVIRTQLAEIERARSATIEIKKDVQYQRETIEAAVKEAEAARDLRTAEKADEEKALAAVRGDVQRLKRENSALMSQLERLRNEFKATLEENRKMVDRLLKKASNRSS